MLSIYAIIIVFFAAILQSSIGFGFALITIPFFMLLYPVHLAIGLNIVLTLIVSLGSLIGVWKHMDKSFTGKLLVGTLFGIPLGALTYMYFNVHWLKIGISLIILVLTLALISGFTFTLPKRSAAYILGVMAGILGTAVSLPGPPLIIYLTARNTDKKQFAGTNLTLFSFTYLVSMFLLLASGHLPKQVWPLTFNLIPSMIAGIIVGYVIQNRINHKLFRNLTYCVLILSSCYSLLTTIKF